MANILAEFSICISVILTFTNDSLKSSSTTIYQSSDVLPYKQVLYIDAHKSEEKDCLIKRF